MPTWQLTVIRSPGVWLGVRMRGQGSWSVEDYRVLGNLPLEDFPAAENFVIEIFPDPSVPGCGLRFADSGLASAIEFPWWTTVEGDLRAWSLSDVPVGSVEDPYADFDQGWQVLIWRVDNWVFLMEGDGEDVFRVWFRVPADRYYSEWDRTIRNVQAR